MSNAYAVLREHAMPHNELRRLALQLATQLPEEKDDALAVLDLTRDLVIAWLYASGRDFSEGCSGGSDNNVINLIGRPEISPR